MKPVSDAADMLDASTTTIGDYTFTSAGNMKRIDGTIDWVQNRMKVVDDGIAHQLGVEELPVPALLNKAVDHMQWWFWDGYRFGSRIAGEFLDEKVLNTLE